MIEEVVEATKQLHHDEQVVSTASSQVTLVNQGKCEQGKLNEAMVVTKEETVAVTKGEMMVAKWMIKETLMQVAKVMIVENQRVLQNQVEMQNLIKKK